MTDTTASPSIHANGNAYLAEDHACEDAFGQVDFGGHDTVAIAAKRGVEHRDDLAFAIAEAHTGWHHLKGDAWRDLFAHVVGEATGIDAWRLAHAETDRQAVLCRGRGVEAWREAHPEDWI